MSDQGKIFTEAASRRISAAVKWVEQHRGERPAASPPAAPGVDPVFVRTTSGTADGSGNYPGVVCLYSATAAAWQEYSAVKLRPANGEALKNNKRYPARPSGRTAGGDELYTVHQLYNRLTIGTTPIDRIDSADTGIVFTDSSLSTGVDSVYIVLNPSGHYYDTPGSSYEFSTIGGVFTGSQVLEGHKGLNDGRLYLYGDGFGDSTRLVFPILWPGDSTPFADLSSPTSSGEAWGVHVDTGIFTLAYSTGPGGPAIGSAYGGLGSGAIFVVEGYNSGLLDFSRASLYFDADTHIKLVADDDGSYISVDGTDGHTGTIDGITFKGGICTGGGGGSGLTGTVP